MAAVLRQPLSLARKSSPPMGKINGVLPKPDCCQGMQRDEAIRNHRLKGELIIEEGKSNSYFKFNQVTGKGKGIAIDPDYRTPPTRQPHFQDHEASTSGMNIFVNKYGNSNAIPTLGSKINAISPNQINKIFHMNLRDNSVIKAVLEDSTPVNEDNVAVDLPDKNPEVDFATNPWMKKQIIKLNFCKDKVRLSEDGLAVKLVESAEIANAGKLECSLVTKVFGKVLPPHSVAWDLRRQWKRFGQFHFTTLGEGWYLCSFKSKEAIEEVLSGGPWFINNHIIGLERWTVDFSTNSLKGLSSPVWIRLPNLPLQCWDEENVALIASMVGVPLMLDGQMFCWGRREFARICVRIELDKPLPLGVWVDGMAGRFFQKVVYERIPSLCFNCGMVGHVKDSCTLKILLAKDSSNSSVDISARGHAARILSSGAQSYGPWLHAKSIRRVSLKKPLYKGLGKALNRGKTVVEKHLRTLNPGKEVCPVESGNEPDPKALLSASIQPVVLEVANGNCPVDVVQEEPNEASDPEVANGFKAIGDSAANLILGDNEKALIIEKGSSTVEAEMQVDIEGKGTPPSLSKALVFNKAKLSKEVKSLGPIDKLPRRKRKDGVGVQETSLYLKEVVRDNEVFFAGLVETKVSSLVREDIDKLIGVEWDFFHHPANGLSRGILVVWKRSEGYFEVVEDDAQVVLGYFHSFKSGRWQVATIYGSKDLVTRRSLWESIDKFLLDDSPSIIGGDFNCIVSKEDKRGGKRFSFSQGPQEMKQFLATNDLHEVGFIGPRFTWCNNKEGRSRIWERLDRCLINSVALQLVPLAFVKHLARVASDHSPIALKINEEHKISKRCFRFENIWRSYPASWNVVLKAWNRKVSGSNAEILKKKMSRALKALHYWNKNKLKELSSLKESLKKEIWELQIKEGVGAGLNQQDLLFLRCKVNELNSTLARLATWWNQRAKTSWLQEGDTNSKFFHSYATARRNAKLINQIKGDVEGVVFEQEQVEKVFLDYFSSKWRYRSTVTLDWPSNLHKIFGTDCVKLMARKSLNSDFRSITDHALAKLNAWGNRALSFAGKVLLIKSLLLSIPIFLSFISLVPKGILQNVDKLCRDFLWNKDKARKGLHYISWDVMCKPKVLGGLGIHSATAKTGPLRARITWRFIQYPNSLCNRIIMSKYGDNVWKGKCGKGQSPSWKILLDGASYLKNVIRWKISNGTKVDVLEDIWILDKPISKWSMFVNCIDLSEQSVSNLLSDDRTWNLQVLQKAFNPDLMNIVTSTKLFPDESEDKIELLNRHFGKSITALAYEAQMEFSGSGGESVFPYDFKKFKLLPKVELFWWRLCNNGIPTNSFLHYRGLIQTEFCPCDCNESENPEHVAVLCLQLHKIINRINAWGFRVPIFDSLSNCLNELKRLSRDNLNSVKLYCSTVYYSLKRRNQVKLGLKLTPINFLASSVLVAISYSFINLRNWDANLLRESDINWCPPPLGWIKINVDATLQRSYNAGIGAIIRDHKGQFLFAFGKNLNHWDISRLEMQAVLAIREHLQKWMTLQKGVIIEGDNKNVISWIQDSLLNNKGLEDVLGNKEIMFLNDFNQVIFNWIPRCCNKVADCCATLALDSSFVFDSFLVNQIPSSLAYLVKKECDYLR
ncbi:hypothetical protein M5K25_003616 [Dendrobium thyrsiflorum]|uniref:CCHC-type domain-containing protein n=1 Tax=Dendrobium thyrsiflorum TaxID=117978 RepID=A0ABD0VKL9_DENTH